MALVKRTDIQPAPQPAPRRVRFGPQHIAQHLLPEQVAEHLADFSDIPERLLRRAAAAKLAQICLGGPDAVAAEQLGTPLIASRYALSTERSADASIPTPTGWRHASMPDLPEDEPAIALWVRLQIGDLPILWTDGGREYNPDFIAVGADGTHWVIEVKMDKEMTTPDVKGKRDAARRWANYVSADENGDGTRWRYLLVSESDVKTAKGSWAALKALGDE